MRFWTLLAVLLLIPLASAAFTASLTPEAITLRPGESTSVTLSIHANETDINITRISVNKTSIDNLSVTLGLPSMPIPIANGSMENITLTIAYDASWPPGSYPVFIFLEDDHAYNTTLMLNVTLQPSSGAFTITPNPIELGSSSQARGVTLTLPLRVQNDQATRVENLTFTFTGESKYNVTLTPAGPYTIDPYENLTLQLNVYVPRDQDAGRAYIGNLSYTATTGETGSIPLYLTTRSIIQIQDVDVESTDGDDATVDDGDRIDIDFHPGSEVTFIITIENIADSTDVDTAIATLTIRDLDDGDDLEVESDTFDIPADDDTTIRLSFTIPLTARADTYDATLRIEAEDEYGAEHSVEQAYELRVERKTHDIRIREVSMPSLVSCEEQVLTIDVTLINIGREDEDAAFVNASIRGTSISSVRMTRLEAGDENERTLTLSLPLNGLSEGTYTVSFRAGYTNQAYVTDYTERTFTLTCPQTSDEESSGETSEESGSEEPISIIIQPSEGMSGSAQEDQRAEAGETRSSASESEEQAGLFSLPRDVLALLIANLILLGIVIALVILVK